MKPVTLNETEVATLLDLISAVKELTEQSASDAEIEKLKKLYPEALDALLGGLCREW